MQTWFQITHKKSDAHINFDTGNSVSCIDVANGFQGSPEGIADMFGLTSNETFEI